MFICIYIYIHHMYTYIHIIYLHFCVDVYMPCVVYNL